METDKPQIAILMAVYEPRMDWLREQLRSLDVQTYPNLKLYIRDDCSPTVPYEEIQACVRDCIHAFPYEMGRNERNLGSNGTFERLTQEAEGAYFAYCDQDDVWLPKKLEQLMQRLENPGALLACSDMFIIDGEGRQTADSITKIRRHHVFHSGTGLAEGLLFHNFVTGCTMLVDAKAAKEAVPFCPYMVHDHYLALWCGARGSIEVVPEQLIRYRVHGNNQTGLLADVVDRASYGKMRIDLAWKKFCWLAQNFPCDDALNATLRDACVWAQARKENWEQRKSAGEVWKYRHFSTLASLFELFAARLPDWVFRVCLFVGKKNWI